MPHADIKCTTDLEIDFKTLMSNIEEIILQLDPSSGACKGRVMRIDEYHHSHLNIELRMFATKERNVDFSKQLISKVDQKNTKIGIIGSGIQGVCSALFLQKKGYQVTLFDRDEPGNAASYGNAGHFSPYASVSLNRTDILTDVPSMLVSSRGPLALKWNYVPKMIPWFARFILNCGKK